MTTSTQHNSFSISNESTPGERVYYKMMRITPGLQPCWLQEPESVRQAYEFTAKEHPDLVPSIEEIMERDREMLFGK